MTAVHQLDARMGHVPPESFGTGRAEDLVVLTPHRKYGAPGTAIIVSVAAEAAGDTIEWIRQSALPVSEILTVTPIAGVGPKAVSNAAAANSLAIAIRDLARRHARKGDLHLFLIGPLGLAVLLGHHWNRLTTTHVYEHLGGIDYTHAFTVEA